MASNQPISETKLIDTTANPGPLGLMGFGLTTVLLNLHNAGLFPVDVMIMAMGIFYGGLAQVIVGIMEWKKNNIFGTVAFTSYGLFWISLVAIWMLPKTGLGAAPTELSMGWYLALWGLFTLVLFIASLKTNKALAFVFFLVFALFSFLALKDFTGVKEIGLLAGYTGILCGFSAIYVAAAEILNTMYAKTVLPLFPFKKK